MVDRAYLVKKPPPPRPWKVMLDQKIVPAVINAVARIEAVVETVSVTTRRQPDLIFAMAISAGLLVSAAAGARRAKSVPRHATFRRSPRALKPR